MTTASRAESSGNWKVSSVEENMGQTSVFFYQLMNGETSGTWICVMRTPPLRTSSGTWPTSTLTSGSKPSQPAPERPSIDLPQSRASSSQRTRPGKIPSSSSRITCLSPWSASWMMNMSRFGGPRPLPSTRWRNQSPRSVEGQTNVQV